jgi:hypothetical protein
MHRLRAWMTLTLTALMTAGALAASDISVTVDGHELTFDQPPLMQDGRVLVPLRGIFEALGAEVQWEAASRTVRARSQKSQMVLPLGSRTATVNGRAVDLDVPASVVGGRTVVPLRFVAEALGAQVLWEGAARKVIIASTGSLPTDSPVSVSIDELPLLGDFDASLDLPRIQVGNQAGLLKILDRGRQKVDYFRTLDDRTSAQVTSEQRAGIWGALGVPADAVPHLGRQLMADYPRNPKLPTLALLGVVGSESPETLGAELSQDLQDFAVACFQSEKDNVVRRQALLATALMSEGSPRTTEAVLKLFETEQNLWVTFPVQMYFQYHAQEIRELPEAQSIRSRIAAVPSLYTEPILAYLGPGEGLRGRQGTGLSPLIRNLAGYGLTGLPPGLAEKTALRQLSLAGNRISELGGVEALAGLRALDLSQNRFRSFPGAALHLHELRELNLAGNLLEGLPEDLSPLSSLKILDLRDNRLTKIPQALTRLQGLEVLDLTGNPLLPGQIQDLRRALPTTHVLF